MQLIVDFGFSYSATKDIVVFTKTGKEEIEKIVGDVLRGKIILILHFAICFCFTVDPILKTICYLHCLFIVPVDLIHFII